MAIDLVSGAEVLSVDAVMDENLNMPSRVSSFPVEEGSKISDNIVNDNEVVTIRAIVSDYPLDGPRINAVSEAFRKIDALRSARQLVTLVTGLRVWESMAITNVSIPRNVNSDNVLDFAATFEHVFIVATQVVTLPPEVLRPGKARDQGSTRAQGGKQVTQPVKNESALHAVKDKFSNFLTSVAGP